MAAMLAQARQRGRRLAAWLWRARLIILEFAVLVGVLVESRRFAVAHWKLPAGDVTEYFQYAQAFWLGRPPLHALPVEYPPLSILPFSLTSLPPLPDFQSVFSWWMAVAVLLGYAGFLRFSTRRRGIAYILYLLIGADAVLLARYDIVPALVTLAALWATERKRFTLAYLLLAAGILLKLYPAFLLPVVMIAQWRTQSHGDGATVKGGIRARLAGILRAEATKRVALGAGLCLVVTGLGFAIAYVLAGTDAFTGFTYASDRPLQVESTPASLLWLGTLVGIPAHEDFSFLSLNYVGVLDGLLKPLSALALVGGCLWVYWRQARGHLSIGQAFLACLCAVVVTNKIFSPQYLIWLLPIAATVDGFSLVWIAICLLTTLDFPILYGMRNPIWTVTYSWQFMPVVTLRNALLVYATLRAILRPQQRGTTPTDAAAGADTEERDERKGARPALIG
jgi:Glycosyltransferase family 87